MISVTEQFVYTVLDTGFSQAHIPPEHTPPVHSDIVQDLKQPGVKVGVGVGVLVGVCDGVGGISQGPMYDTSEYVDSILPTQAQNVVAFNDGNGNVCGFPLQSMYWIKSVTSPKFSTRYSPQTQLGVADGVGVGVTGKQGPPVKISTGNSVTGYSQEQML